MVSSEQITGWYDPQFPVFRPARTNLADLLIHAAHHPWTSHVVYLDELNLGRVEHYLAPFLSLKEHADVASGWPLYSAAFEAECLNRAFAGTMC